MMRRLRANCGIRLGRQQIEPSINLKGVGAENFGTCSLRYFSGDLRLPDSRRSYNKENAIHGSNVGGAFEPRSIAAQRRLPHLKSPTKQKTGRPVFTASPGFAKQRLVSSPNDARSISPRSPPA